MFKDEEIILATWVAGMGVQSSPRRYRFVRARDLKPAAQAETLWVFCDAASGRAADIPSDVRDAFPIVDDEAEIAAAISAA